MGDWEAKRRKGDKREKERGKGETERRRHSEKEIMKGIPRDL